MRRLLLTLLFSAAASHSAGEVLRDRVVAPGGHYELCRVAYTSSAGSLIFRATAVDADPHDKWNSHFGVALTDADGLMIYKVAVIARKSPLRLQEPQQVFVFANAGKEIGSFVQQIVAVPAQLDLTIDFTLEWFESGFARVFLNGQSLGLVRSSRPAHQWNIFVSEMTVSHDLSDLDPDGCRK